MNAKISVNGQDAPDLLARVQAAARRMGPAGTSPASADALAAARTEAAYQDALLRMLREHGAVDANRVEIPRGPGAIGAFMGWLRTRLWKGLRYQHEQVAVRHNAIHALQSAALEYERGLRRKEMEALEKRVRDLEARLTRSDAPPPGS